MHCVTWILPIKTVSEINCSEHWSKKHKRHKIQQLFVRYLFQHEATEIRLPCTVKLTRLSPRQMDCDNLPTSMKYIKDQIAEQLTGRGGYYITKKGHIKAIKGHADNDKRITWSYHQEKYKILAVKIEISFYSLDNVLVID